jgi:hypothetical protein
MGLAAHERDRVPTTGEIERAVAVLASFDLDVRGRLTG